MSLGQLNERAAQLCDSLLAHREELRIEAHTMPCGATVIDAGVAARGGLEAGRRVAAICQAGLGEVQLQAVGKGAGTGLHVATRTDQPLLACLAAQYAGWKITGESFFAMGSGPMRLAAGKEELLAHLGLRETAERAVGVLETSRLPNDDVCRQVASDCGIAPEHLTLVAARTASQVGTVQVVARAVETALHKLHELNFELATIESAAGSAPLPPVAADDLGGIGRTNDAVLYGGEVTLWVRGPDDETLADFGQRTPSSASADHGEPFAEIFARYDHDFYRIDPLLFSPAVVTFVNLKTGRQQRFGEVSPQVLERSFAS